MMKLPNNSHIKNIVFCLIILAIGFYLGSDNPISHSSKYEDRMNVLLDSIKTRNEMIYELAEKNSLLKGQIEVYQLTLDSLHIAKKNVLDSIEQNIMSYEELDSVEQKRIEDEALKYLLNLNNNEQ